MPGRPRRQQRQRGRRATNEHGRGVKQQRGAVAGKKGPGARREATTGRTRLTGGTGRFMNRSNSAGVGLGQAARVEEEEEEDAATEAKGMSLGEVWGRGCEKADMELLLRQLSGGSEVARLRAELEASKRSVEESSDYLKSAAGDFYASELVGFEEVVVCSVEKVDLAVKKAVVFVLSPSLAALACRAAHQNSSPCIERGVRRRARLALYMNATLGQPQRITQSISLHSPLSHLKTPRKPLSHTTVLHTQNHTLDSFLYLRIGERQLQVNCELCDARFPSSTSLRRSLKSHHPPSVT